MSVCLSVCLFVCLSACLSVCLSVSQLFFFFLFCLFVCLFRVDIFVSTLRNRLCQIDFSSRKGAWQVVSLLLSLRPSDWPIEVQWWGFVTGIAPRGVKAAGVCVSVCVFLSGPVERWTERWTDQWEAWGPAGSACVPLGSVVHLYSSAHE